MSRLVGAMLVRNEAGRWLERVLEQLTAICDETVVLDDASTDGTPTVCRRYPRTRVTRSDVPQFERDELVLRQALWSQATGAAGPGGWVMILDADETLEPAAVTGLRRLLRLADQWDVDGLAFRLFDMWDADHYRDDALWRAHYYPAAFAVRYDPARDYAWHRQPLHCGRFPVGASRRPLDTRYRIQHWGWSRPEDRQRKYLRYVQLDPDGRWGSPEQYASILDPNPHLVRWQP